MQPTISDEQRSSLTNMLRPERWIVRQAKAREYPPHLRLFCFPYAGGGASIYRPWSSLLPREIEVCAIQLPGHETRVKEPAFTRLSPLVRILAYTLQSYLDVPFVFFGHSMGALISFELARYLRHAQMPEPLHLFVSAHRAPQLPDTREPLHCLSDATLLDKLSQLGGTPQEILRQVELMQFLLPTIRADFTLCETYGYRIDTPLSYPITAFGGAYDTMVSEQETAAWHEQTRTTFALHMFDGDHFFLKTHAKALLHHIETTL